MAQQGGNPGYSPTLQAALNQYEGGSGGANALYGQAQNDPFKGVNLSNMTVGQVLDFAKPGGAYMNWVAAHNNGTGSTPMGYGQIVGSTLKSAVKKLGISPDAKFDADTQGKIVNYLAANRVAGKSPEAARAGLRSEWTSLRNVPDTVVDRIADEIRGTATGPAPSFGAGTGGAPAQTAPALGQPVGEGISAAKKQTSASKSKKDAGMESVAQWLAAQGDNLSDPLGLYSEQPAPSTNNVVINGKLGLG